jgi:hypothetical protein
MVIYRHVLYTLLEPEDETHFTALKKLLPQHSALFQPDELRNLYTYAMNYCIRNINLGKPQYLRELFDIYRELLQRDLLLDNNQLSPWDYKNILTTALRLGEYEWSHRFLHDYKSRIDRRLRANAFTYNLARYYFAMKQYNKVLPLLQDVKYDDIFYQLDSKSTLLKIFYEQDEYSALQSLKESFMALLRRKRLMSEQNRVNYRNLIHWTLQLSKADVRDKLKLRRMRKEISAASNVADKSWLLEKVDELL